MTTYYKISPRRLRAYRHHAGRLGHTVPLENLQCQAMGCVIEVMYTHASPPKGGQSVLIV